MSGLPTHLDAPLQQILARAVERLRHAAAPSALDIPFDDPAFHAALSRVAIASDFAVDTFERQPELLQRLSLDAGTTPLPAPDLSAGSRDDWARMLRRWRAAESARLVWRDVLDLDDVDATLAGTTRLAEQCLQLAHDALEAEFIARHGVVRDRQGQPVRLVVFALGKLGGGELNFSSDVDLVYAYPHEGESDGPRPLPAETWCMRLGQALAKLLDEVTVDGFCHRVDLRLRPFGGAGRLALSFGAMEQYFQREGRDWERYAWQKARPVAGDIAAGEAFLSDLRPFVYRRYLDFGALDGLRGMKAAISAEVARKELADDIKRGRGGIREIEFFAQVLQLIHGGRDAALRGRRLQPALQTLAAARHVPAETAQALLEAYRWLRRLENRLQMLRDAQVHALPEDPLDRARIAAGLGLSWDALAQVLAHHREVVALTFDALLHREQAPRTADYDLAGYWRALPEAGEPAQLEAAGFGDAQAVDAALRDFARSPGVRDLPDIARTRLERVMPVLLQASAPADRPLEAVRRLLALLHNVLRRSSYLALLDEQPAALARLVDLMTRSAFLAERVAMHPLLLDELLDARIEGPLPGRAQLHAACEAALARDDVEAALYALNEVRQTLSFRIALAMLDGRQGAQDSARQLAWLADGVVAAVLELARRGMHDSHGRIDGARFAVLGYGSLGGEELGVGSDLDLVFLYDAPATAQSDGPRPLDAIRWHARLAQKMVALLGTVTGAGRLYEVDIRLRPDGASGLLVSSLASYDDYQRERAWTWEHQALVRARAVAGDDGLVAEFERVRAAALARQRDADVLRDDIVSMRQRMRGELDRSRDGVFDLKQGEGGLVDLEFLVQYLVLREAHASPELLLPRATPALLEALCAAGVLAADIGRSLREAHATLLALGLGQTLDRRPRLVPDSRRLQDARASVRAAGASLLGIDPLAGVPAASG
ncbi:bifunctional [glutamate--ammonia ligase]-adenylyl-L-tyrosine phosphorylase/[glutamate--ammonia-ligase] adenylyltransferase [Luteimonas yindakuii]|uniref:bifunctional [glutamate--ammonia ligase]-adenylyl-L-tyrosine phosphorylase/[glutamate--ammonia-ligase] adenylyltransferase n=1 Tax=Luteimonas yindakuii TaxID=2565782 RepID=UPI0011078861|nr:bifunctional [glutamate--ammonia ligase]-adenylyl-L-tyrosine phosphorylase/[glutamate--ammonia-ligase] adenylyltransferase [Luteimonas yindakuii]QCU72377.1 bifunctional [glutamate--ammonia ligase]-adenylyl-L-tyrosine phosphorylase/[glutamate--ammonia-ligase] adenylyltransferase [Luteimonas yindakuii]